MWRSLAFGFALVCPLLLSSTRADITVEGTVYYWSGDAQNADGAAGDYVPARSLWVHVECDKIAVGDIDTWTDANGKYKAVFKRKKLGGDFASLKIDVEVRAAVLLDAFKRDRAVDVKNTVSTYRSSFRAFPYNGQTRAVEVQDGNSVLINVYVQGPDSPYAESSMGSRFNLPIASWDYDDDGRHTLAGIFLCQTCEEVYRFLCARAADKTELSRSTMLFYSADFSKTAYRDTQSPTGLPRINEGTAWIDVSYRKLFDSDKPSDKGWNWRILRCTVMHEFSHKLMHDVYWTMPKTHPWMNSSHDATSCTSGEMGWREGWAEFLPAAVLNIATMAGEPVCSAKLQSAHNLEHSWHPSTGAGAVLSIDDLPGEVTWRDSVKGRRDWNEVEVAAVLWDIYDPPGWEYMPKAQQDVKPAGWPADLKWHDQLCDSRLERIWRIVKMQPEALNDEDESVDRDSFWTYWLQTYGSDNELVHGLKAILHNRDIRHTLRPENKPVVKRLKVLADSGDAGFAELRVKESDAEDRPFLSYNVAFGAENEPLRLLFPTDRQLTGFWNDDELTALIRLPARNASTRIIVLVHDNMEFDSIGSSDERWENAGGTSPKVRLISAGEDRSAAVRDDGTVWTWGAGMPSYRYVGLLGEQKDFAVRSAGPLRNTAGFVAISCGYRHTVALRLDGTVWNWGENAYGSLAIEGNAPDWQEAPLQVPGLSDVVAISAGQDYTFALKSNGELWAWGSNFEGKLGDGTTTHRNAPVKVAGLPAVADMAAGVNHSLAVDTDGNVWAWGRNGFGQLGDGEAVQTHAPSRLVPAKVLGIDKVAALAVHIDRSIALKRDGTVWEWGARSGRAPHSSTSVPSRVPGLHNITAIGAGGGFQVALRSDGTVWSWGEVNWCGQLGCGPLGEPPIDWGTTHQVSDGSDFNDVTAIAVGSRHGILMRRDGSVWSWGGNGFDCLGHGSTGHRFTPIRVQQYCPSSGSAYAVLPFEIFQH